MLKYRLVKDYAAVASVENNVPATGTTGAPIFMTITKQFKTGDIVEGVVGTENKMGMTAGTYIWIRASSGVVNPIGAAYPGEVVMYLPLSALGPFVASEGTPTGATGSAGATGVGATGSTGADGETGATGSDDGSNDGKKYLTTKNIIIGIIIIAVIIGILKWAKVF